MGTHLRVLSEGYLMNTYMPGFRWFSHHCALDESSLSIGSANRLSNRNILKHISIFLCRPLYAVQSSSSRWVWPPLQAFFLLVLQAVARHCWQRYWTLCVWDSWGYGKAPWWFTLQHSLHCNQLALVFIIKIFKKLPGKVLDNTRPYSSKS